MSCNPASRKVMEKIGMKFEGTLRQDLLKDGVYYDIDRLSILKSEYYGLSNSWKFQVFNTWKLKELKTYYR